MKKTFLLSLALFGAALLVRPSTTHASTVDVQSGDSLWAFSQKYDVSVQDIAKTNGIDLNHYMMWPGDKINITDGKPFEDGAKFNNHVNGIITPAPLTTNVVPKTTTVAQVQKPVIKAAPVQRQAQSYQAPTTSGEASAKAQIAYRESRGSYTAQNGRYYGKYQLDLSYLHGDLSSANQEATANRYVQSRYHSWSNALAHSNAYGWY